MFAVSVGMFPTVCCYQCVVHICIYMYHPMPMYFGCCQIKNTNTNNTYTTTNNINNSTNNSPYNSIQLVLGQLTVCTCRIQYTLRFRKRNRELRKQNPSPRLVACPHSLHRGCMIATWCCMIAVWWQSPGSLYAATPQLGRFGHDKNQSKA